MSNRSTSYLTAFNTQVLNLISELQTMYPDDPEFKRYHSLVEFLKKANPRMIHDKIMGNITEYKTKIFAEDEDFFAEQINERIEQKEQKEQKKEDANVVEQSNVELTEEDRIKREEETKQNEYNFNMMMQVRTYWKDMPNKSKKNIWMYLKVLFKLSDRLKHIRANK